MDPSALTSWSCNIDLKTALSTENCGERLIAMLKEKEMHLAKTVQMFFSVAVVFCFLPSRAESMQGNLTDVVYALYRDFSWEAVIDVPHDMQAVVGRPIAEQPRAVLEQYFDAHLASLLHEDAKCKEQNRGEVCNLDFDPIFASQDSAAYDLVIKVLDSGDVGVEFVYPSNDKKIHLVYKVKKTSHGFRISDIVYKGNGDSSLMAILKTNNRNVAPAKLVPRKK